MPLASKYISLPNVQCAAKSSPFTQELLHETPAACAFLNPGCICTHADMHHAAQALPGRSLTGSPQDHDQSDALDMTCCIVHAAVVAITATYTAVAALHDQPFRALYSVAFVCALDMACWAHSRLSEQNSCKRKPL